MSWRTTAPDAFGWSSEVTRQGGIDPGGRRVEIRGVSELPHAPLLHAPASAMDKATGPNPSAQRGVPLETLTAILEAMVGCIESATRVAFDFAEDDISVTFADGAERPFWMLSDGQRGMAALVADIAMRCTLLNPHLNGDACRKTLGVVLIDELDLHLHPRWQRRVVQDLRRTFPGYPVRRHEPFALHHPVDGGLRGRHQPRCGRRGALDGRSTQHRGCRGRPDAGRTAPAQPAIPGDDGSG